MKSHYEEIDKDIQLFAENINGTINCDQRTFQDITDNILYYIICGYVVIKLTPQLTREYFIDAITNSSSRPDHTYCNQVKLNSCRSFANLKNRGGLQLASKSVFKIIKLTEQYFKSLLSSRQETIDSRQKNIDLHIMSAVQNTLALSTSVLLDC